MSATPGRRAAETASAAKILKRIRAEEAARRAAAPPIAHVRATRYTVNCVPEDFSEASSFAISVSYRGHGLWWVHQGEHKCLGADGTWAWGFRWSGGDREPTTDAEWDSYHAEAEEWTARHRFDGETAKRLASAAAPYITVMGRTVADALVDAAAEAATRSKEDPNV